MQSSKLKIRLNSKIFPETRKYRKSTRAGFWYQEEKKVPDQLLDSKLSLNESKWLPWSSRINLVPFRTFKGTLVHKPVTCQVLFLSLGINFSATRYFLLFPDCTADTTFVFYKTMNDITAFLESYLFWTKLSFKNLVKYVVLGQQVQK